MSGASFGIDIGGTKVQGIAVDRAGAVVASARRPTRAGAQGVVGSALEVVAELRKHVDLSETRPVGVGVPGRVDRADGRVLHPVNLGLREPELRLAEILSDKLDHEVIVENDVNAATLGAQAWLRGVPGPHDLANVAYLSLGTGVAAGVIIDGVLRRGATGTGGEVGHVPIADAPKCGCGQSGCLELFASGSGLARRWPTPDGYALASLMPAVSRGESDALAVWQSFTDAVASALRLLALTVDPSCFVLGGGLTNVGDGLLAGVRDALVRQASGSPFLASLRMAERVSIIPPGYPVGALGAAVMTRTGDLGSS